jgi:hypothetical protein
MVTSHRKSPKLSQAAEIAEKTWPHYRRVDALRASAKKDFPGLACAAMKMPLQNPHL